jgi:glycosyltransferase involved in cell wall biosynthesis
LKARPFPIASVIVPAYNDASSIARCLRALLEGSELGEFDVIVVCNACTDATASIARSVGPDVRVLETPVPSKTRAMNLGDEMALAFPRVYVDADVVLETAALRAVVRPLLEGAAEASAPGMRFETSGSPWTVRAFHDVWRALPQVRDGLGGRGVYAVSEAGHRRFGTFPEILADDLFIDWSFPVERREIVDVETVVYAETSFRQLIRRKSRIAAGRLELLRLGGTPQSPAGIRTLLAAIWRHPRILPKVPIFVLVTLHARRRGRRQLLHGAPPAWEPLR